MFLEFCFFAFCWLWSFIPSTGYYSLQKIYSQISLSLLSLNHSRLPIPNAFWNSSSSPLCSSKQILLHLIAALLPVLSVKGPHCLRYLPLKPESFVLAHIFSFYLLYIPFQTTGSVCSFTISLYPMLVNTALVRALFFFLRLDAFHFPLLLIFSVQSTSCCK